MSNWTKATSIPPKVKQEVYDRDDGCCIFCGAPGIPEAHYVPRSKGGLGIAKNILSTCRACHRELDEGKQRSLYREVARKYLQDQYPDWDEKDLIYRKRG